MSTHKQRLRRIPRQLSLQIGLIAGCLSLVMRSSSLITRGISCFPCVERRCNGHEGSENGYASLQLHAKHDLRRGVVIRCKRPD
jgi:hypothetical protein